MSSEKFQYTGDEALRLLSHHQGASGELVRAFHSKRDKEEMKWLETWFQARVEKYFAGPLSGSDSILSFDLVPSQDEAIPLSPPTKLKSLEAHYFRGFCNELGRVNMGADFIVIEGRNSSGKTSLAEAVEWLFSGTLSRRESSNAGSARELEHCITNVFRPANDETWVKATFVDGSSKGNAKEFTLRRVLQEDYGTNTNATCNSVLFLNDKELTRGEERQVLDKFFAGVPPLLMQHTLRDFVQGNPKLRQQYFERLLQLEELTELIRQAVMTDERAALFPSPSGGEFLRLWNQLAPSLRNDLSRKAHSQRLKDAKGDTSVKILDTLSSISRNEFPSLLNGLSKNDEIVAALQQEQLTVRQNSFLILAQLRPRGQLSELPQESRPTAYFDTLGQGLRDVWKQYETISLAVQKIGDANLAVAKAYKLLLDLGTIQPGKISQTCPLCAYEHTETLSASRISAIESWNPIYESEQAIQQELENARNSLVDVVKQALEEYDRFFSIPPTESAWDNSIQTAGDRLREEVGKLRTLLEENVDLSRHVSHGRKLIAIGCRSLTSIEHCESFIESCTSVVKGLAKVPTVAKEYLDAFIAVEAAIGDETSNDPQYRLRERLIECFENTSPISDDIRWEQAKRLAQKDLRLVRESLITYRQQFLDARRMSFNKGIESVWKSLRDERYSSFSQLHIPKPRGKGFPVEIELKAILDDSNEKKEVDALRVFSESQVNALGIAAFVTRAKLLGHRLLIFDDPVQSMDEEHFKTFASTTAAFMVVEGRIGQQRR